MDFISNYFELIIIILMVVIIWFLITTRAAIITADDRHTAMMMYQSDRLEEISKSISGEDVVDIKHDLDAIKSDVEVIKRQYEEEFIGRKVEQKYEEE